MEAKATDESLSAPCAGCGAPLAEGALFCQSCGSSVTAEGRASAWFAGAASGPRCARCGEPVAHSAVQCDACGHRARSPAGSIALDEWLAREPDAPLAIIERSDRSLLDRLIARSQVRHAASHPSGARVPGTIARALSDADEPDPRAIAEDLGGAVLLVDRAHRLANVDLALLDSIACAGGKVALRAPRPWRDAPSDVARGADREPELTMPSDEPARRLLVGLAILGYSAELDELNALGVLHAAALRRALDDGILTRTKSHVTLTDPDAREAILGAASGASSLGEMALELRAASAAPLAARAEAARFSGDDATSLLLFDMHAREALEGDELEAARESLEHGLTRVRRKVDDSATVRVGSRFARTLSEVHLRQGARPAARAVIDEALGWPALRDGDRLELEIVRHGLAPHLDPPDVTRAAVGTRALASCDLELARAHHEPSTAGAHVRGALDALAGSSERLSYGMLLACERAVAAIGDRTPAEGAEILDELLESRLASPNLGLERLWRLRARLARR
ncbi:MAG: zinc ribbon domain-containing protein [Sandaracinaceae bacterium]